MTFREFAESGYLSTFMRDTGLEPSDLRGMNVYGGQFKLGRHSYNGGDLEILERIENAAGMTVVPLIAPESSIEAMVEKFYPEETTGEETLTARNRHAARNQPADPIFWDIVAELETGDLDQRLTRIEQNLDRIWVLLEKVLRTLEIREGAGRAER